MPDPNDNHDDTGNGDAARAPGYKPSTSDEYDHHLLSFMNLKYTFDLAQTTNNNMQKISEQIIQNAVTVAQKISTDAAVTADLIAKQAVKHEGHDPDRDVMAELADALALRVSQSSEKEA